MPKITPSLLGVLLLLLLPLSGCVSKSTYQDKVEEAALLKETVGDLETQYQKLLEKQRELVERNDELSSSLTDTVARNAALQEDLLRARADLERLEKVLAARDEETGEAMAEMRNTIDRLEEQNRKLSAQVEQERLAREARIAKMKSTYNELVEKMEEEIERGEVTISELKGKLTVNMVERILFDSGSAELKPEGLEVLGRVGDVLSGVTDKRIRVEGHTDNVPISPRLHDTFPSNWELSTARATNVVHYLQDTLGIPGERLAACGFGPYRPVADNDTAAGRAQNRRIQIVLVPAGKERAEPQE